MNQKNIYLIPNEYIPILVKKKLFLNPEKAVKTIDNISHPLYVLDDINDDNLKKTPNAFFIYRSEVLKNIKINNPNKSSREISVIIGKNWNQMTNKSKLPYQLKAKEIKDKCSKLYHPTYRYKKILKNIKKRDYLMHKEFIDNSNMLAIKKLLFEISKA